MDAWLLQIDSPACPEDSADARIKKKEGEGGEREFLFPKDKSGYDAVAAPQRSRASCLRVIINYRSCRFSISRCIFGGLIIPLSVLSRRRKNAAIDALKNWENNH